MKNLISEKPSVNMLLDPLLKWRRFVMLTGFTLIFLIMNVYLSYIILKNPYTGENYSPIAIFLLILFFNPTITILTLMVYVGSKICLLFYFILMLIYIKQVDKILKELKSKRWLVNSINTLGMILIPGGTLVLMKIYLFIKIKNFKENNL